METHENTWNTWKQIKTPGNTWKEMKTHERALTHGNTWKHMEHMKTGENM